MYAHSRFQGEGAPQEIRQVLLAALTVGRAPRQMLSLSFAVVAPSATWHGLTTMTLAKTLAC